MNKIIYIANARIPSEKTHGLAIMKMCEGFAKAGMEVELIAPRRFNVIKDNPFKYYGAERNFKITKLHAIDLVPWFDKIGFFLGAFTYAISATIFCLFKNDCVFYGR